MPHSVAYAAPCKVLVETQPVGRVRPYVLEEGRASIGTVVVVESERGVCLGRVTHPPDALDEEERRSLSRVIRVATREDVMRDDRHREWEAAAFRVCLVFIEKHRLPMKLIRVHYMLTEDRAVFYFAADGRVDFRALVRDLASKLRTRIEMRQIGVRDETKMLGGIGECGRELCCATWLREFIPVSIRMAKDQNLALNPQKVSGACGRLMCCLAYEHENYVEMKRDLPKVGRKVKTRHGPGRVTHVEILKQRFLVELDEGGRRLMTAEDLLRNGRNGKEHGEGFDV